MTFSSRPLGAHGLTAVTDLKNMGCTPKGIADISAIVRHVSNLEPTVSMQIARYNQEIPGGVGGKNRNKKFHKAVQRGHCTDAKPSRALSVGILKMDTANATCRIPQQLSVLSGVHVQTTMLIDIPSANRQNYAKHCTDRW